MDAIYKLCILLAGISVSLGQISDRLKCIECTHIAVNRTKNFQGSTEIYDLLSGRYNEACGWEDPYYQLHQQGGSQGDPNSVGNLNFGHAIRETICPAFSLEDRQQQHWLVNKCNLIYGDVHIIFPNHGSVEERRLKCIECTHINFTRKYDFPGVQSIYSILDNRYNPQCAKENPYHQDHNEPIDNRIVMAHGIRTTMCPPVEYGQVDLNRCNLLWGDVDLVFKDYNSEKMRIHVWVRDCQQDVFNVMIPGYCYIRHNTSQEVNFLSRQVLGFLGSGVKVERFEGHQCVCSSHDECIVWYISSSPELFGPATMVTLLASIVAFFVFTEFNVNQ